MPEQTIVDLFAGTGGMGLAALSTRHLRRTARIVWTAEVHGRYARMISRNYATFGKRIGDEEQVPRACEPVDLSRRASLDVARGVRRRHGRIGLMLAGPPCQGFSLANRRSRSHENPLNGLSLLVSAYVRVLEPRILILENVPGIRTLPAAPDDDATTTDILTRRLRRLGYATSIVLLDAADFGVPQFRLRSFLVAARNASAAVVGRAASPKATHGPEGDQPYVTVRDAIGDLPRVRNGAADLTVDYAGPPRCGYQRGLRQHANGLVSDHVTTRHSKYVLDRYSRIRAGGNWTSIRRSLTNYADAERTHLNIYHRLLPSEPAKTIGNFRKAMTVHPSQDRGLSLREAARLQSLPDWMTFCDPDEPNTRGVVPGLNAYQQQIGNAVSYRLTRALVSNVAAVLGS